MDDRYLEPQDVASFITLCVARGVRLVVVAWQDEWAQTPQAGAVDYSRVVETTLLAYHEGHIIRLAAPFLARDEARRALEAAGLTVELRSRNLTR